MILWPGIGAAAFVATLILGTFGVVALSAPGGGALNAADMAAIRFTVTQALVSAALSTVLAVPVARALARQSFPGRPFLITLLGAPFLLPVIVAVMGLLAVFGRSGWVSDTLGVFGLDPVSIYGFWGVVLAHVFFNLPLATRVILQGWLAIPAERFRLAAHLGFGPRDMQRHLEWPMLGRVVPGAFAIIFAICMSSFAVALTLGGGPKATTVELAIYQAFRFDFDLGKATVLASVQLGLAGVSALLAFWLVRGDSMFGAGLDRPLQRYDGTGWAARTRDWFAIASVTAFLALPLAAIAIRGAPGLLSMSHAVWSSALMSLGVALLSAALAMMLALAIALCAVRIRILEGVGLLAIASSPLVIGTGLFIVIFSFSSPQVWALPVTAVVNAVMALPFALRVLVPAVQDSSAAYGRLSASLGLSKWATLRLVTLPRCRAPLGFAAGLAAALSMGDLGVVALFASAEQATLPLQVFRLMGAYRMEEAAAASVLLASLSFALFWTLDAWGRRHA